MNAKTASQLNTQNGATTGNHTFTPKTGIVAVQTGERRGNPQRRDKVEWTTVKVFDDQTTGLAVGVQMLALQRPKFSLVVGSIGAEGYNGVSRFIRPAAHIENAQVTMAYHGMVLARLVDEATVYIGEQLQAAEDNYIVQLQQREQRELDRSNGGQKKQLGLSKFTDGSKTVREADKRVRHENNLAARRSADQERTSRTKGRSK